MKTNLHHLRKKIQYLSLEHQAFALIPDLTVFEFCASSLSIIRFVNMKVPAFSAFQQSVLDAQSEFIILHKITSEGKRPCLQQFPLPTLFLH